MDSVAGWEGVEGTRCSPQVQDVALLEDVNCALDLGLLSVCPDPSKVEIQRLAFPGVRNVASEHIHT